MGEWEGEITHEINTELDDESYEIAISGDPEDGSEGFDDVYIEPSEGRPVISYTKHFSGCCGADGGTLYLDIDLTTLSSIFSSNQKTYEHSVFVLDSAGAVIAHPSLIGENPWKQYRRLIRVADLNDPVASASYTKIRSEGQIFRILRFRMRAGWCRSPLSLNFLIDHGT